MEDNEEYKIGSLDELNFVARKWRDVESRIEYVAMKISQLADDGEIPVNFIIDADRHHVFLNYASGKLRTFPIEILLMVPDETIVGELVKPWLDFISIGENGEILKATTQQ